jgi:hypothetical protein
VLNGTVGYEYPPAEKKLCVKSNSTVNPSSGSPRIPDEIENENENEKVEVKRKTYTLSLDVIGDLIYPAIKLDKVFINTYMYI